ncbi:MAG: hypothetical protein II306_07915, partial [Clostridia bacterium]|nr:hypothetical protein [Clostridia bacterium]
MKFKKLISIMLVLIMICTCFCACSSSKTGTDEESTSDFTQDITQTTEPEAPETVTPVDIDTDGGVVLVGKIGFDENEWYFQPEQPLNITFEYIMDKLSVFKEKTRIKMFAPELD